MQHLFLNFNLFYLTCVVENGISLNICSVFLLIYSCIHPSLVTVRIHPFSQASSPTVFRRVAHSRLLFSSSTKLRWVDNAVFFLWMKELPFGCNKVGQCIINAKVITKVTSKLFQTNMFLCHFRFPTIHI